MSPSYISELHDCGLLRSDGTTKVGMMLARDPKTNQPIYRTVYDDYFVNRAYASSLDYAATDPQSELRMIYTDWRRGFGQYIFDSDDSKRYYSSIGCDLRFKDMAVAGPVATGIAMPAPHTASAWNLPTNYADPSSHWSTEANAYDNDTGTGATSTTAGWTDYLYLAIPAISCTKIQYWWQETVGDDVTDLEIDVYYGGAWHTIVSDDSAGEGAFAEAALGATYTVTGIRVRVQTTAGGGFSLREIQLYGTATAIQGYPVDAKDFNDLQYIAIGNTLYKMNATASDFTFVASFPAPITSLEVHASYLYIALGSVEAYWYMNTSEAFTRSNAAVNTFKFFCTVHTTAQTLYGNDGDNTIRSTTNPLNGGTAWSAQTTVGSSYNAITDKIQKAGALYIMKEDMPYYLNSAGAVQNDLAPECASLNASTSGKNVIEWLKKLYIPIGAQGLLETDGTTNTWRNPASYSTNLGDFVGRVQGLASDEEWLFAIVDNSTKVEVVAGREETIDGSTDWVWHPICEITLTGCETAWVSSVYQKRLWIASTSSSDSLYYIPLPTGYGNITSDANRTFQTNSYFITPFYHGGFKGDTKRFIKAVATLGHAYDADIYWECWYKKLEDSSWTDAGDFIGTSSSRIATLYIPVDASSNKPTSTMMQFKLVAKTDDTQKTPILLALDIRAVLYPTIREIIECEVVAGDYIHDKEGGLLDGSSAAYIETVLDEARDSSEPFSFYDPWGNTITVKMLPVNPYSYLTYDRKGENLEQHFVLRMQKIALS